MIEVEDDRSLDACPLRAFAFIVGGLVSIAVTVPVNDYVIRARIWRPRMPRLSAEVSP